MEENWLCRTGLILGKEKVERIKKSKIAIFGLGGVRFLYFRSFSKKWCRRVYIS